MSELRYWRSRAVPACVVVSTDDYSQTRDELIPAARPCAGCLDAVAEAATVLGWSDDMIRRIAAEFDARRVLAGPHIRLAHLNGVRWERDAALTRVRELEAFLDRTHAILRDLVAMRETLGHYDFAVLDKLVVQARVEIRARAGAGGKQ